MGTGLICIGLTTLDVVARPIDALPQGEGTTLIQGIGIAPAGTAAGAAMVAARLGVRTRLAGSVGGDLTGRFVRMFRIFPGETPGEMVCLFSVHIAGLSVECYQAKFGTIDDSKSDVTLEDYDVAEGIWSNLAAAGEKPDLIVGRNEPAVQAFHRAILDRVGLPI